MRVDYQFPNKTWSYLHYNQFSVGSTSEEYPLTVMSLPLITTKCISLRGGGDTDAMYTISP